MTFRIASQNAKLEASLGSHRERVQGRGFGSARLGDLIERAPIMIPINALGYDHFVVFCGIMGNHVLVADPAWGNRTMTIDKFQRTRVDYGEIRGHVGFVVELPTAGSCRTGCDRNRAILCRPSWGTGGFTTILPIS